MGDAGKILDFLHRISPQLTDTILLLIGFQAQHTNEIKSEDAPDNVFEPIPNGNYDKVRGDFDRLAIPSVTDWIDKNPPVKYGAIALGLAALAIGTTVLGGAALLSAMAAETSKITK